MLPTTNLVVELKVTKLRVVYSKLIAKSLVCVCVYALFGYFAPCRIFNYVTRVTLTETWIRFFFLSSLFFCFHSRSQRYTRFTYKLFTPRKKWNWSKANAIERYRIIDRSQLLCVAHTIPYKLFTWASSKGIFFCTFIRLLSRHFFSPFWAWFSLYNRHEARDDNQRIINEHFLWEKKKLPEWRCVHLFDKCQLDYVVRLLINLGVHNETWRN